MADYPITAEWIETLLDLASIGEQIEFLQSQGVAHASGLEALLDYTEAITRHQPHQAQALTYLCEEAATPVAATALKPRAIYLRAQTHVLNGELQVALGLIQTARDHFTALSMGNDALRTDIGLMNTLARMGEYRRSIDTGNFALSEIDKVIQDAGPEAIHMLEWMRATIYVTMGPALSETGHFTDALDVYTKAERIFTTLESTADIALVLNNRGVALRYLGRVDEALAAYEQAIALLPPSGYFYASLLINIGDAQMLLGNYKASLDAYADAAQAFKILENSTYYNICTSHLADAYLALNLYSEALALYQEVSEALQSTDLHYYRGKALWGKGTALRAQSDRQGATNALTEAENIFIQLENRPLQAAILLEQVSIYTDYAEPTDGTDYTERTDSTKQDDSDAAFALMARVFALLDNENGVDNNHVTGWPVQKVYAHLRMADLLLPNVAQAESHLNQADVLLQTLALPHLRYRLWQRQGHVRRLQNRYAEAQTFLEAAVGEIEQLRTSLATEAFRISFQQDKIDAYQELILLYLDQLEENQLKPEQSRLEQPELEETKQESSRDARLERTFDLIERAKSRALVERMSGVVGTFINEQEEQEEQAATTQLQQLQLRLNAIYTDLLGQGSGDIDEAEMPSERSVRMAQLHQQATEIENEVTKRRLQATTQIPTQGTTQGTTQETRREAAPSTYSIRQIQQLLADEATMLSYHIVADEIMAFVITKHNVQVVRHISSAAHVQHLIENLNHQWSHFRGHQSFIERHLPKLEENAQQVLFQLYQALLAPLVSLFNAPLLDASLLDASLLDAPLLDAPVSNGLMSWGAAPHDAAQKSVLQKLIVIPHGVLHQVPFQALFDGTHYLIERALISYAPSVTVYALCQAQPRQPSDNILALAVSDPAIPAVEAETKAIAQALPQATILLNEAATISGLTTSLTTSLAHSRVLHFACHGLYREDNPMFSSLRLYDSWLTATHLSQLDLQGAMVVLSACESGKGVVLAGDEMMGLTRAGLSAGARGMLVSQWLVQDDTGAMLMAEWYARLARGQSAAVALRAAQRSLMSSHPHPYYWAPFIVMGNEHRVF